MWPLYFYMNFGLFLKTLLSIYDHVTFHIPHMNLGLQHITFFPFLLIIKSLHSQNMWQDIDTYDIVMTFVQPWIDNDDIKLHDDVEIPSFHPCCYLHVFMIDVACYSSFYSKRFEDMESSLWSWSFIPYCDIVSLHLLVHWSSCLHNFISVF